MSGAVNTPRTRVYANGNLLAAVMACDWSLPLGYHAGKFTVQKAFVPGDTQGPEWFADTGNKAISVEIQLAPDGQNFVTVFQGGLDSFTLKPIQRGITLTGRDGSAVFIDTRITSTYRNSTSSEIAATLAAQQGLKSVVTPTTTLVGRYYDQDNDQTTAGSFSRAVNEWDLICLLAQREGFVPYVMNGTLYFQAPPASPPVVAVNVAQVGAVWDSNALNIDLERNLTMARDVKVTVKSWHSGKKAVITGSAVTKSLAPANPPVPPTEFTIYAPNLTQGQADLMAQRAARDFARWERPVSFEMPGVYGVTPLHVFVLSGSGTDYDGITLFPDDLSFSVNVKDGFTMTAKCKNFSPIGLYDGVSGAQVS